MLAFTSGRLFTSTDVLEHPLLLVENGRVLEISTRGAGDRDKSHENRIPHGVAVSDFGDATIAPGYVDLHIHGNAGFDVMDDSSDTFPAIETSLAKHGVTSYFPTTVTAPLDTTLRALERTGDSNRKARRQASGAAR